jgi:outer membrane lipopolysaccharide assembly protein LptE/RlpB
MHTGFLDAPLPFMLFRRRIRSLSAILYPLLCVGSLLSVVGCGWHLQGSARMPASMTTVHIDTQDRYSDFYRELRTSLLAAGAQLTAQSEVQPPTQTAAPAVIHIKKDETNQRLSSVSTNNRPEQYEVYYRVVYSVDVGGVEKISDQPLELTANYSYDTTAVLAKQREQLSIQQGLARELAGQVLRQLTLADTAEPSDRVAGR